MGLRGRSCEFKGVKKKSYELRVASYSLPFSHSLIYLFKIVLAKSGFVHRVSSLVHRRTKNKYPNPRINLEKRVTNNEQPAISFSHLLNQSFKIVLAKSSFVHQVSYLVHRRTKNKSPNPRINLEKRATNNDQRQTNNQITKLTD